MRLPSKNIKYKPLDETKNEIRILRFLDLSSTGQTGETVQCSIENVPLQYSSHFRTDSGDLQNKETSVIWDLFTECVGLRDSNLEKTTISKAISIARARNSNYPGRSRYTWGDFEALYTLGAVEAR